MTRGIWIPACAGMTTYAHRGIAMTWNFEQVAGPFPGAMGSVAWDGEGILFSLIDEQLIKKFYPQTGAVKDFRAYTGRINGIAVGPEGVYACQESGRRII